MQHRGLIPWRKRGLMPGLFDFSLDLDDFFDAMTNPIRADLRETDTEYILEADLPGYDKEGIEVHYEDKLLTISAKQDNITEEKGENYIRRERRQGSFSRSIPIPEDVDSEKIKASFNRGVLQVILPKVAPSRPRGRKIDIN